jgi:RNA recognition motif-containing protein
MQDTPAYLSNHDTAVLKVMFLTLSAGVMSQLFLSNVPWNSKEAEVRQWIETRGFPVDSVHVVRDLEANASPAFAYVTLQDNSQNEMAIQALNGQKLKDRVVKVTVDWREARAMAASIRVKLTNKE